MAIIDIDQLLLVTEDLEAETVAQRIYFLDIDQVLEKTNDW
jgi:hypothetical protein